MFGKARDKVRDGFGILDFGGKDEEKSRDAASHETTASSVEEQAMKFLNEHKTKKSSDYGHEDIKVREEETYQAADSVSNKNPRLKIYKPTYYEAAFHIGKDITEGKIVLLDMSELDKETSIKILQFVGGICFALNIEAEEVNKAAKIFSIDPQNKKK